MSRRANRPATGRAEGASTASSEASPRSRVAPQEPALERRSVRDAPGSLSEKSSRGMVELRAPALPAQPIPWREASEGGRSPPAEFNRPAAGGGMLQPNQRVSVDLSNLTIKGVHFSQNVQKALATVVELVFSFKGIRRVEVPEDRIHPM